MNCVFECSITPRPASQWALLADFWMGLVEVGPKKLASSAGLRQYVCACRY